MELNSPMTQIYTDQGAKICLAQQANKDEPQNVDDQVSKWLSQMLHYFISKRVHTVQIVLRILCCILPTFLMLQCSVQLHCCSFLAHYLLFLWYASHPPQLHALVSVFIVNSNQEN